MSDQTSPPKKHKFDKRKKIKSYNQERKGWEKARPIYIYIQLVDFVYGSHGRFENKGKLLISRVVLIVNELGFSIALMWTYMCNIFRKIDTLIYN